MSTTVITFKIMRLVFVATLVINETIVVVKLKSIFSMQNRKMKISLLKFVFPMETEKLQLVYLTMQTQTNTGISIVLLSKLQIIAYFFNSGRIRTIIDSWKMVMTRITNSHQKCRLHFDSQQDFFLSYIETKLDTFSQCDSTSSSTTCNKTTPRNRAT